MNNSRGVGMVDVIVALFLLAISGVVFTATYPSGFSATRQGGETKVAVTMAQQKLEQVESQNYESLTYANLLSAGLIDSTPTTSPYSFTTVDDLTSSLAGATGTIAITDDTATAKLIVVTITWESSGLSNSSSGIIRSVTLRSLVSDKRPWRRP